jgi:hypothetical protein
MLPTQCTCHSSNPSEDFYGYDNVPPASGRGSLEVLGYPSAPPGAS